MSAMSTGTMANDAMVETMVPWESSSPGRPYVEAIAAAIEPVGMASITMKTPSESGSGTTGASSR